MALIGMSDRFPIHKGTLLASSYEVQAFLGEGGFGKVAKCMDVVTNTKVAIKITKDDPYLTERAMEEIKILKQLQTLDPDKCSFVRWNGSFFHERFICLEFELLDLNLHDYMAQRRFQPLSIGEIRPVVHQMTTALLHLEALEIMHADVKPENIMVVDRRQQPLQVKLIDFGLARSVSDAAPGSCVQTLWYRAPEVMLGLVFMETIDMWSLGLVVAELALGCPLFPGEHEYDMMKFIVDTLDQPPDYLLNCAQHSNWFFCIEDNYSQKTWRLKTPEEFAKYTGHHYRDTRCVCLRSLDALEARISCRNEAEWSELKNFVNLLKKMLLVDKNGRIMPLKVLEHPFLTVEQHTHINQNMNNKNQTVDKEEDELNFTQQPSSHKMSVHCVASKATNPHIELVSTDPENVSAKLEDVEDKAADIQPEVLAETSEKKPGLVKRFFQSTFVSWFRSDDEMQ